MGVPLLDLEPAFERHGPEAVMRWLGEHLHGVMLQVATGAVSRAEVEDGDILLWERICMHLTAEALTAPVMWKRWQQTKDPQVMEAYGATQGIIRVTSELIDEYGDEVLAEHIQDRLDRLVEVLSSAELPDSPPAL